MSRRRTSLDADNTPAIARVVDAARAISTLFTLLFFGSAIGIVVLSFGRGGV